MINLPPDDLDRQEFRRPSEYYDNSPSTDSDQRKELTEKLLTVVDSTTLFIMLNRRNLNISATAKQLRIGRSTIYRRVAAAEKKIRDHGPSFFDFKP